MKMTAADMIEYLENYIPKEFISEHDNYYTLPTICHNEDYQNASQKLYLYKNENSGVPLFTCYTGCGRETFNIYQLVQKINSLRGKELTWGEAYREVHGNAYIRMETNNHSTNSSKPLEIIREFNDPLSVQLPTYSTHPLDMFFFREDNPWALEGVDLEILNYHGVGYSAALQQIVIPHRDWRGRLVGIRVRNLGDKSTQGFKYMPLFANNSYHSHPLSLNLYGIFYNQNPIKENKRVFLYEGEKSVLFHEWMFDNKLALAVCGSSISRWHQDMLVSFLGVEEVIIGFDKEYQNWEEMIAYVNRLKKDTAYLRNFCRVGVLLDTKNVLKYKESPVDGTVTQFNQLEVWWLDE